MKVILSMMTLDGSEILLFHEMLIILKIIPVLMYFPIFSKDGIMWKHSKPSCLLNWKQSSLFCRKNIIFMKQPEHSFTKNSIKFSNQRLDKGYLLLHMGLVHLLDHS